MNEAQSILSLQRESVVLVLDWPLFCSGFYMIDHKQKSCLYMKICFQAGMESALG